MLHNFLPHLFLGACIPEGFDFVTSMQEFRCNRCGSTISLPDCGKSTCRTLLSFGCDGKMEKIPWKAPIKSRSIEDSDINKRDYPAKKAGNIAKKRKVSSGK